MRRRSPSLRRLSSVILFVIGGFCVGMQVMIAFVRTPEESEALVSPLIFFTGFAALFLAPATWISPGHRWRKLGLTLFLGATIVAASTASLILVPDETGFKPDIAPLRQYLDPVQGFANLGAVIAAGIALSWFGGGGTPLVTRDEVRQEGRAIVRIVRDGSFEFGRAMKAAWRLLSGRT